MCCPSFPLFIIFIIYLTDRLYSSIAACFSLFVAFLSQISLLMRLYPAWCYSFGRHFVLNANKDIIPNCQKYYF